MSIHLARDEGEAHTHVLKSMLDADRVFVVLCCGAIAAGVAFVAGMVVAAWSFAETLTFRLPFVATIHGFTDQEGGKAVSVDIEWWGLSLVLLALTVLVSAVVLRRRPPRG
ncbi:hypothetical protein CH252_25590 [Rhodococcus sp. 06-1477-1B]|nr:hypothetical protein CH252_25590 [Rhodococcus sp. 06-1477-1B]